MTNHTPIEQAEAVFRTICRTFKANKWKNTVDRLKLTLVTNCKSAELQFDVTFCVQVPRKLVYVYSPLKFTVQEDRELEMAVAVNLINERLLDGFFDYDITTGKVKYRMACAYTDCTLEDGTITYMMHHTGRTMAKYGTMLTKLATGQESLGWLYASIAKERQTDAIMETEDKRTRAEAVFDKLCSVVCPDESIAYKDKKRLWLDFMTNIANLPVKIYVQVDAARETVCIETQLYYRMSQHQVMEAGVAACAISHEIAHGGFFCDLVGGQITYKLVTSFRDSQPGDGLYKWLNLIAEQLARRYYASFWSLEQKTCTIDQIIQALNQ